MILENALRNTTASITALQRVSFILLAAHSLKQKLQIAFNKRKYEGSISSLLSTFVIGLFSYHLRFVRKCFQLELTEFVWKLGLFTLLCTIFEHVYLRSTIQDKQKFNLLAIFLYTFWICWGPIKNGPLAAFGPRAVV